MERAGLGNPDLLSDMLPWVHFGYIWHLRVAPALLFSGFNVQSPLCFRLLALLLGVIHASYFYKSNLLFYPSLSQLQYIY